MAIIVSDPTLYFVFEYPKGFLPSDGTFSYIHSSPYLISTEWSLDFEIPRFCLPYNYHSEPVYKESVEASLEKFLGLSIPDEYIMEYQHTLVEMTEFDVNTAFIKRALEYYDLDMNDEVSSDGLFIYQYLDFHYSKFHYDLNEWLDYVSQVFKDINKYIKIPQLSALKVRKMVNDWIDEKREELAELNGETVEQQPPTVEAVEEELDAELEKTAHKVVLLHELGVIGHLQKRCKEKNPTMSDTKFAELIGLILGLQGKKIEAVRKGISGYGQGTKDDPKTPTALQKVKSELLKFGIEL